MMRSIIMIVISTVALTGCVTDNHRAYDNSLAPIGDAEAISKADRNRVHIVILNGSDPFRRESLDRLVAELNAAGFAQVSYGGLLYAPYFETKLRKIAADDPDSRFIIIGQGLGITAADAMTARLSQSGLIVSAVVAIEPMTMPGATESLDHDVRRVTVSARDAVGTILREQDVAYKIDDTGTLLEDHATAGIVLQLAKDAVQSMPKSVEESFAALPMIDNPAPLPRSKAVRDAESPRKQPVAGELLSRPK
jgi:hypothetical protein